MDTLDISFNFFGNESDIVGVVFLNRLETFLLYGNPVLGPTGEDPMFIYIEDVVDQANDHRDKIHSTISYIDVSHSPPRVACPTHLVDPVATDDPVAVLCFAVVCPVPRSLSPKSPRNAS